MKLFLATALLVGLVGVVTGSPAEARIREQFDKEHEEGIDRIRLKVHDVQAAESGNKDRQYQAQQTDTELRVNSPQRSRSRGGGRERDVEASGSRDRDEDRERDRASGSDRDRMDRTDRERVAERERVSSAASDRDRDRAAASDRDRAAASDRDRLATSDRERAASSGGGADLYLRGSDKKVYDRQHEDTARFAKLDDIDFAKDSYRKKDKTSHKKEEIYNTRR